MKTADQLLAINALVFAALLTASFTISNEMSGVLFSPKATIYNFFLLCSLYLLPCLFSSRIRELVSRTAWVPRHRA